MEKYFLKSIYHPDWKEVTKKEWIKSERAAGFRPKCSSDDPEYMTTCATGGFFGSGIEGKIKFTNED